MKLFNPETKTYSVFKFLYAGNSLTQTEAEQRFNVKNLSDVTEYAIGKPSREIVALGYKAKSMGITL
ncbi:MAG: hypothetical protein EBS49_02950 [Verrucomicrobia bacterium]|nr:hypothetical protein [Verrucomicrobiota bacterium]